MNCEILRTLYVKANGEILCNDDHGEQVSLGMPDYQMDDCGIHEIFSNEHFDHIRKSFSSGSVPWPGICEPCALFRPLEAHSGDLLASRVLEKIQFESSLACALKCPSCSNLFHLRNRKPPVHFPVEWMNRLLSDLRTSGYQIQTIEFCGQGEPLNHPKFKEIIRSVRSFYPSTRIRVITNGNHEYGSKIGSEFVEEIVVSIDGVDQESYEKYRVNGKFDKAVSFLRDAALQQISNGGRVIWKYILFTSNDSDDQIIEAQRLANEMGISRLWIVHGHGDLKSQRLTFENSIQIPIKYPRVKIESHPSFNRDSISLNNVGSARLASGAPSALWLDTLVVHPNRTITLIGWAGCIDETFDCLLLRIGNCEPITLPLDVLRPDIRQTYPSFARVACGFDTLLLDPRTHPLSEALDFTFELNCDGETLASLQISIHPEADQPIRLESSHAAA